MGVEFMRRNHKNIMLLGTGSNVGKSIIAAGLCRIFYQDRYSVVPFKSQNMALNSFITKDGKEMGRAQVVQAEAANIEPQAFMNPILLKPTTDRKSQVIVNGKVYKNMDAREYFAYKHNLKKDIMAAYNHIRDNFDICVLEGAGSPAEINLKEDDIVNTGMAEMADSPVILVADIDRGGVFAAIYGTIMLLEESEKKRIKGVIINKFRGDKSLLTSGIEMIEKLTDIPVIGVVPFVPLGIEEEDSLGIDKYNEKREEAKVGSMNLYNVAGYVIDKNNEKKEGALTIEFESIEKRMGATLPDRSTLGRLLKLKDQAGNVITFNADDKVKFCAEGHCYLGVEPLENDYMKSSSFADPYTYQFFEILYEKDGNYVLNHIAYPDDYLLKVKGNDKAIYLGEKGIFRTKKPEKIQRLLTKYLNCPSMDPTKYNTFTKEGLIEVIQDYQKNCQ